MRSLLHSAVGCTEDGLAPERLAANPELLVDRLLRQTWDTLFVAADRPENPTGMSLIDAEFCTDADARRSLRAFEDFRGLVGVKTWNPSRGVNIWVRIPRRQSSRHGFEPGSGWEQTADAEQVAVLIAELRRARRGGLPLRRGKTCSTRLSSRECR